jgi:hypothetical protein
MVHLLSLIHGCRNRCERGIKCGSIERIYFTGCKYYVKEFRGGGAIRLNCVLYMTLMVFIYVYFGLFIYTNLLDVIQLVSPGFFHSIYPFLAKKKSPGPTTVTQPETDWLLGVQRGLA